MNWIPQIQGRPTPFLYEGGKFTPPEVRENAVQSAVLQSLVYFNTIVPEDAGEVGPAFQAAALQSLVYFNTIVSRTGDPGQATQAAALQALTYFLAIVSENAGDIGQGTQNAVLQSLTYFLAIVSRTVTIQNVTQSHGLTSLAYA
jgi:hypothetical protein